jgi:SsrA-binding protein
MEKKISNKEAYYDYQMLDEFEAGLVLKSDEIKAIRSGRVNLKGAFGKIFYNNDKPGVFLVGAHFYTKEIDPYRTKQLLLHRNEIDKLIGKTQEKGLTLVPLEIFITRGKAKLRFAVAKGKKEFDKRDSIKKREEERKISRVLKSH